MNDVWWIEHEREMGESDQLDSAECLSIKTDCDTVKQCEGLSGIMNGVVL